MTNHVADGCHKSDYSLHFHAGQDTILPENLVMKSPGALSYCL